MEASPDIEIYIKDASLEAIQFWLEQHFSEVSLRSMASGHGWIGSVEAENQRIPVSIFNEAAGKRYSCLVFDTNHTPWQNDLDCARSAWQSLRTEIRCSAAGWQEGDDVENERWWRLDERGEAEVSWN